MADQERGLYRKFDIKRTDGSSEPGGKHHGCAYFVLDLTHDEFAIPALRAYAAACREKFPALAADIDEVVAAEGPAVADRKGVPCSQCGSTLWRRRLRCNGCGALVCGACITVSDADHGGPLCAQCADRGHRG